MRRLRRDRLRPHEVEAAIAEFSVERLYLYDAGQRQVAIFEGDEANVFFSLNERERQRVSNGLLVHNHPPKHGLVVGDPRYGAESFSPDDWRAAASLDVAEFILVTPTWRHRLMRPVDGWLAVDHTPDAIAYMLHTLYDHVTKEDAAAIRSGQRSVVEADASRSHRVNLRYAGEIGAIYQREPR